MANIQTMTSGIFTYMDVYSGDVSGLDETSVAADFEALFAGATVDTDLHRLPRVREFPAVGVAANITNVPMYGQRQSGQVSGQSDAPNLDVTVNWVGEELEAIEALKGQLAAFRFMIAESEVTPALGNAATLAVNNNEWYFIGKIEAIQVTPSLTDSVTAVINISSQFDTVGPATLDAS